MKTRQAAKIAANGKRLTIIQRYDLNGLYTEFVLYSHDYRETESGIKQQRRQIGKYPSMWQAMSAAANEF